MKVVAEKENLKRSCDDDERPLPERLSLKNSPKGTKVQLPPSLETSAQLKSIVTFSGNFRIPLKENQKMIDNGSCNRDDGLSMPPLSNFTRRDKYNYDRHGSNRQCGIDGSSFRSTDHHRHQTRRRNYSSQSSRRDDREALTPEQQRWLSQMPRYWR